MALYGGKRDISVFRSINRELINRIITVQVDIYKVSLNDTKENVYGEAMNKTYYAPMRISTLMSYPDVNYVYEKATIDVKRNPIFNFLRDDLIKNTIMIEVGDIIDYDGTYWEIDTVDDKQLYMTRNPESNKTIGEDWGWSVGIECNTHMTRRTKVNQERMRSGTSTKNEHSIY